MLKDKLPTATHLQIAIWSYGGAISQGTTKSAIRVLTSSRQHYGRCRKDGKIIEEELGARVADVMFATDHKTVASAPLPDVSTAYYSTGIPNISGYLEVPASRIAWIKSAAFRRLLDAVSFAPFRWITDMAIGYFISGPSDEMHKIAKQEVWARGTLVLLVLSQEQSQLIFSLFLVYDIDSDKAVIGRLTTPEGYIFTACAFNCSNVSFNTFLTLRLSLFRCDIGCCKTSAVALVRQGWSAYSVHGVWSRLCAQHFR